jgi:hypothetical protein
MSVSIPSLSATPSLPVSPAAAATTVFTPPQRQARQPAPGDLLLDGVQANTAVHLKRNCQQRDTPI